MKNLLLILFIAIFAGGCYYDNEEQLYPKLDQFCDTTSVSYSIAIKPILQTNCFSCHSAADNAANGGSLNLEDFQTLKVVAEQGILFGSITHNSQNLPMPKNGAKLDTCSITKIKIWIDKGALNN